LKISEVTRRREDFLGDAPVTLADGQTWFLPKPRVRFGPGAAARGFRSVLSLTGVDDFQDLVDALDSAARVSQESVAASDADPGSDRGDGGGAAIITAELGIAVAMLRRNYELSDEEVGRLIQFGYDAEDDPEGSAMRETFMDLARGVGPKASSGGSAAPTS
jgi:hypothetical protein